MVNYYDILKISPNANRVEIKSAYRRLARKLHPDRNNGSEETALKFAVIAEAYEILGNPKERDIYDRRVLEIQHNGNGMSDSVFASTNSHAKRWRQMVYEKRYNEIIDRLIAEERSETLAFQRLVFPTVALFVSAVLSTALRPQIFIGSGVFGKGVIIVLFVIGLIHIAGRFRDGLLRYTDNDDDIHDSILDDAERESKPYSRIGVAFTIVGGIVLCLGVGALIGTQLDFAHVALPEIFSAVLEPEFFLYPPIVALFVDLMHTFASRFET